MSSPEKDNLNSGMETADEKLGAVNEENEVPSDSELPEVPSETYEVSVAVNAAGDNETRESGNVKDGSAEKKSGSKNRAAVIVSAEEVEKSKVAEKRRVAAEEEKKKKRNSLLLKIFIPVIVIAFAALAFFESNLFYRVVPAVQVNDTKYSVAEFNYFYTNTFSQMYQNVQQTYGDYANYFIDPSKPLKDQPYSETQTWEDAVKEQAMHTMKNLTCLVEEGKKAGFEMTDASRAEVDSAMEAIANYSVAYGYSENDYLTQVYGRGMNSSTYRDLVGMTYYASDYSYDISNNPEPVREEIDARYAENPDDFDTVSFRYFYIAATSSSSEESGTPELAAEAKKKAEAMAGVKTEQEFMDLAEENVAEEQRETFDKDADTRAARITHDAINTGYVDWLYEAARKTGDTYVYEAKNAEDEVNGYYVIYYLGRDDIRYNTVNVRHILVTPERDSEGNATDEAKQAAKDKADALLKKWVSDGGTEDAFAALAAANSADSGSVPNGGLYENVYVGQMATEFNDWCFDSSRKPGDTEVVETEYGYHVMYFVGEGESYFDIAVKQKIEDERYAAWQEENLLNYTAAELPGIKYGCNK